MYNHETSKVCSGHTLALALPFSRLLKSSKIAIDDVVPIDNILRCAAAIRFVGTNNMWSDVSYLHRYTLVNVAVFAARRVRVIASLNDFFDEARIGGLKDGGHRFEVCPTPGAGYL
jgi:hypothetical protein